MDYYNDNDGGNPTLLPNTNHFEYCIMYFNIQGLQSKCSELKEIISRLHRNVQSIMLLTDNLLTDNTPAVYVIPGYNLI